MKTMRPFGAWAFGAILASSPLVGAEPQSAEPAGLLKAVEEANQRLARVEKRLDAILRSGWEYRFLQYNLLANTKQEVDQLGREGWEFIGISEREGFMFKRRLPPNGR